ncbi:MAG: tetratricopeptide repeat protein [Treponemataceae bacterium]|nr:tetratricopeptide repeat protein [Treponemataceae bacterium]
MKDFVKKEGNVVKRKSKALMIACISIAALVLITGIVIFFVTFFSKSQNVSPTVNRLYKAWEQNDYQKVYDDSALLIEKNPLNINAVIFHGYSSFFLALSQNDVTNTQNYLDEAINCIRFAIYSSNAASLPQLYYMLGKAYFQKNSVSGYYYYSDLVIKYLQLAVENGYESPDISEYMGLCYADLGMTQESIIEFTRALKNRKSDILLYSIALQYYKNKQSNIAKPYLVEIISESSDDDIIMKSSLLLADISFEEGKFNEAKKEYENISEKFPNCADAYYGLGNIYEKNGDTAKARSEWRKAVKLDVNHIGARKKLGL